jgi:hypothetical protein
MEAESDRYKHNARQDSNVESAGVYDFRGGGTAN